MTDSLRIKIAINKPSKVSPWRISMVAGVACRKKMKHEAEDMGGIKRIGCTLSLSLSLLFEECLK